MMPIARNMKNVKAVARASKKATFSQTVPLYYSVIENAVYTDNGDGRYHVTDLIRENSADEIVRTVMEFLAM